MKKLLFFLSFIFIHSFSYSQIIFPLGKGTTDSPYQYGGEIRTLFTDTIDNILYAGGDFTYAGSKACWGIAKWDGTKWDSLGSGMKDPNSIQLSSHVRNIVRYKNEIYVTGNFRDIGSKKISGLARWNGTEWNNVGGPLKKQGQSDIVTASALEVYNGELYVSGQFDTIGTTRCNKIAKWDGVSWTNLGLNYHNNCSKDDITDLIFYNNELYAAGNINCFPINEPISKMVGNQWIDVGLGIYGDSWVNEFTIYQNNLYVAGYFFTQASNTDNSLLYINGTNYYPTAGGVLPSNCDDIFEYKEDLYVCGQITSAGFQSASSIAKWNGSQWTNLGFNVLKVNNPGTISAFERYNDKLIVAGHISSINGTFVNNIAMIDFNPVGFQLSQQNKNLKVFPNPASEVFNIQLDKSEQKGKVCLYNQIGQQVYLQSYGSLQSIAVNNFAKGIYVVEVETEKGVMRQKVVIE